MSIESASTGSKPWYDGRIGTLTVASYVILTPALMLATAREVSLVAVLDPVAAWLGTNLTVLGAAVAVGGVASLRSVPRRIESTLGWGNRGVSLLISIVTILGLFVAVYGLPLFVSQREWAAVSLERTVSLDVYLYAIIGAAARLSYDLVGDARELAERSGAGATDDALDVVTVSEGELLRLVIGLPAAVYLAAGIALLSDVDAGLFSWASSDTFVGFAGLSAGLFIKRAYRALGDVADRLLEPVTDGETGEEGEQDARADRESTGSGEKKNEETGDAKDRTILSGMLPRQAVDDPDDELAERPWFAGWWGRALLLVVFAVVVAVTLLTLEGKPTWVDCSAGCVRVPFDIYLYGGMGGLAYVFTTLFVDIERDRRSLVESKFRIVAGILLAVGAYVLLKPGAGTIAPLAFLVGLYPKVALERLNSAGAAFFDKVSAVAGKSPG